MVTGCGRTSFGFFSSPELLSAPKNKSLLGKAKPGRPAHEGAPELERALRRQIIVWFGPKLELPGWGSGAEALFCVCKGRSLSAGHSGHKLVLK